MNPPEPTDILRLYLDALEVPASIGSVTERKRVQKAMYLGQALGGVDLGYRFNWYLMGPYCPALAKDYYAFTDDEASKDWCLRPDLKGNLDKAKSVFSPPSNWSQTDIDWLELVASYDFLRRVRKFDHARAVEMLQEDKAHLAPHAESAKQALAKIGVMY